MKKYRDEIAMVCHEMMKAGQSIGAVSEKEMKELKKIALWKSRRSALRNNAAMLQPAGLRRMAASNRRSLKHARKPHKPRPSAKKPSKKNACGRSGDPSSLKCGRV